MYVYANLPTSVGNTTVRPLQAEQNIVYTYSESEDEVAIYNELDQRLLTIESSEIIESTSHQAITEDMQKLRIYLDGKEELQMRLNWLDRLYQTDQQLKEIQTKEEAKKLLRYISICQTSPLKRNLSEKLEKLVQSLPSERVEEIPLTDKETLMTFAIEEAGNDFINLGKAGREYIIQNVLEQFGKEVPVTTIQEVVDGLNKRLIDLIEVSDVNAFQIELEKLPLPIYETLSTERKQQVAEHLMEDKEWKGLMSLSQTIRLLDEKLDADEEREMIKKIERNFVTTLTIDQLEKLSISIHQTR